MTTNRTRNPHGSRLTSLLALSTMGVYLLVVVGATTAVLDGASACSSWPLCDGGLDRALTDPGLLAAWGHRVGTLLTGALLVASMAYALWVSDRRVTLALAVVLVLYSIQIGIGGVTALSGTPIALSTLHLVLALTIFSGTLLALLWQIDHTAKNEESETGPSSTTRPSRPFTSASPTDRPTTRRESVPDSLSVGKRIRAYVRLTKPKLWWLLCLVAVATMILAVGGTLNPETAVATVVGGILAIGACGTFNNVFEVQRDRRMERTDDRPLVTGTIQIPHAIAFGVALTVASVIVFVTFVNALAAILGVLAILFYSVVYTLVLKPNTPQNVVIGGAVGAFPALIGWAAVEETIGLPAILIGAVIFLWTPAHFYNLALAYRDDYARAGIPMLPVVRGATTTYRHILLYLGATMVSVVVLGATTDLGWVYGSTAVVAGTGFLWAVVRLTRERSERAAFRAFHASNAYLGSILVAIVVDSLIA